MNSRGVVSLVRGWVELYTRGLPPAVRAARRDEVEDDLWCQHDEADGIGRSPRSLAGEILLRLLLGMPSDLTWRTSQTGAIGQARPERSPSTAARVIGVLAIIGGATWGTLIFFTIFYTPTQGTGTTNPADTVLILAGGLALTGAIVGPAWLFQDQINSGVGLAAATGALAMVLVTFGVYEALLVVPVASTFLVWELLHIGVLSRALAVTHGLSAAGFVALFISAQIDYVATLSNHLLMALGVPYMLTWIIIGGVFLRGVPRVGEPAREA